MLKIIAMLVLILIVGVLVLALTKPDELRVHRATTIKAVPDKIFPLINDFRSWGQWSPYEKRDPDMKRVYSGAGHGKGAVYEWNGNANVGAGRMEILEATPPSKIAIKLDFIKPFEGHNTAEFIMQPQGDATTVTWLMYGPNSFFGKVMGVFMNMDKMIGTDFETGLANLKTVTEK